jgi:hypothetical protein
VDRLAAYAVVVRGIKIRKAEDREKVKAILAEEKESKMEME